jgi:hypothetical protein
MLCINATDSVVECADMYLIVIGVVRDETIDHLEY